MLYSLSKYALLTSTSIALQMQATKIGVVMSLLSLLTMVILFTCETWSFVRTQVAASVEVDPSADTLLRLNFNVTLYDVECEYVSVDVWDRLGTNLQNVTKDITKWHVDPRGKQQAFHGRNKQQQAVQHEQHKETLQDIKDMNEGELHATDLSPETIQEFHKANHLTFVDYFAPWCIWCQRLAPTWEKFAAEAKKQQIAVGVGKVDCVEHQQMCKDERVMAFPTLRWYEDGKAVLPDYKGDRTVGALLEYAKKKADKAEGDDDDAADDDASDWEHHPGCQVSGHLMVNRVPGNLHIEAKSIHHDWNSALVNLTHRVNHLSFGSAERPAGPPPQFPGVFLRHARGVPAHQPSGGQVLSRVQISRGVSPPSQNREHPGGIPVLGHGGIPDPGGEPIDTVRRHGDARDKVFVEPEPDGHELDKGGPALVRVHNQPAGNHWRNLHNSRSDQRDASEDLPAEKVMTRADNIKRTFLAQE